MEKKSDHNVYKMTYSCHVNRTQKQLNRHGQFFKFHVTGSDLLEGQGYLLFHP